MLKNLLFIVSGPSGAGKRTLIEHIVNRFPNLRRVPTYTTRPPRSGEVPGIDYVFISDSEFRELVVTGEIFEFRRTYGDHLYGSPSQLIRESPGADMITEMDPHGMLRVRANTCRHVVSLFLLPPEGKRLVSRIERRANEGNVKTRVAIAQQQIPFAWAYDYILLNDVLEEFLQNAGTIVEAELLRRDGCERLLTRQGEEGLL